MPIFIMLISKKRKAKNYQEILYEYFKILLASKNILKLVSKEIKSKFFMNMSNIVLNKYDELKYLILMKESFRLKII